MFNPPGDWIGFGCMGLGQLLVWEWQSECYVLKQQGHYNNMTCLDFSLDGQLIVSGAEDGKVRYCHTRDRVWLHGPRTTLGVGMAK